MFKNGVFISYSHQDKKWLDKLLVHLKPLVRDEKIRIFADTQLQPGTPWRDAIMKALQQSRIAVLLVSPNFLASDFIAGTELPKILKDAVAGEIIIYWIAVSYAAYQFTELAGIQSVNDPKHPLDSLSKSRQNEELVKIAHKIANAVEVNVVSNVLHVIDEFAPQQEAFLNKASVVDTARSYSIQARQRNDAIHLTSGEITVETITAADFEKLDNNSKQLIRTYERAMKDLYDRWTELLPKSIARDELLKEEARHEMSQIRVDLCGLLNSILDYLDFIGKRLEDHYYHVRYICTQNEN